ncbi:MAG: hypothetical protein VYE40_16870 [Myxococcota bacterium]|jgi:hypothetical protein|nr:hypothetical protein [Myxococcota bacterium]MEC9442770.1 hypothetical protein [Myxococcota bacterium]
MRSSPTYLTLAIILVMILASGCARYGWADRAEDSAGTRGGQAATLSLLVETISAPADRALDLQRATQTLTHEIERCGPTRARWGELPGYDLRVRCVAIESETRGFDQQLLARVTLACDLVDRNNKALERVEITEQRAIQATSAAERIERARLVETEALAAAAATASCQIDHIARDILSAGARTDGKASPE